MRVWVGFVVLLAIFLVGCTSAQTSQEAVVEESSDSIAPAQETVQGDAQQQEEIAERAFEEPFQPSGNVLAGSTTPYVEFNEQDYQQALSDGRTVLLYFYANWCPICRAEQQHTTAAFDELENPDVVGFRVNYKDSATEDAEEDLARQFGITYQHTKVLLVNGEQQLKDLAGWDKAKYLAELS